MSKKKKVEMIMVCDKCGKLAPKAKESNENFELYDAQTPCECGGSFKMKLLINGEIR